MDEKAKELKRQYQRNYYHNHKEKQKAANIRYWNKKAAQLEAKQAAEAAQAEQTTT